VNVSFSDEQTRPIDGTSLVAFAERVLVHEGYPDGTEVSITAVTDDAMAALKSAHFGVDQPTDVLSFPIESFSPGVPPSPSPGDAPVMLGDVVVAPAFVSRQATDHGVSESEELLLMVVHGILHLMGWDHVDDGAAEAMEARERDILALVGVERR
jgi:probable rRNA maturation factor